MTRAQDAYHWFMWLALTALVLYLSSLGLKGVC